MGGYTETKQVAPKATITPAGDAHLPPILDMLGVRYVIFRGSPPTNAAPAFLGIDYWVLKNPAALPRAYIPQRIELATNATVRLQKLASPEFDPREVGYVEAPVDLPISCRGSAEIVEEIPTRITISLRMGTPGMVVLADRWDKGWQAYLSGKQVPILRANHAVRGVVVPAGNQILQFRYEPASFAWGLKLAGLAGVILAGWIGAVAWEQTRRLPRQCFDQRLTWETRTNYLPLVTAGQRPVFAGDDEALRAVFAPDFDSRRVVYLPWKRNPKSMWRKRPTRDLRCADSARNGLNLRPSLSSRPWWWWPNRIIIAGRRTWMVFACRCGGPIMPSRRSKCRKAGIR